MPDQMPPLPVVNLDDYDDPASALNALLLAEFVAGAYPASCTVALGCTRDDATLLPPGVAPERSVRELSRRVTLARGDGWLLRSIRWTDASAEVVVVATSDALADEIAGAAVAGARIEAPPTDTEPVGFWYVSGPQPRRIVRRVAVPDWPAIRANYTRGAADAISALQAVTPDDLRGRLVIAHGPPGTGKTTALLTIARAWKDWCSVEYVLDPETLLRTPGYLMHVVLRDDPDDDDDDTRGPWRLLVLEDCDELIRADAKSGTGQSLARLLNLTDGVVGRGLRTLVCITTNEDVGRLHPAVTRPGRCLANIAVGRLSRAEAVAWLGTDGGVPADGMTLAELDAHRHGVRPTRRAPAGMYL